MNEHLRLPSLPFHIGPSDSPENPAGLPAVLPFELRYDSDRNLLVQVPSPMLDEMLNRVYVLGLELGTPLGDDSLGRPYAEDFLAFIDAHAQPGSRALEIGAGVGYTSRRLIDRGWKVDSLEPGGGYRENWDRYGIEVINDFFPTDRAPGPYDLIVCYAVVEHIAEPETFLRSVGEHLSPSGLFIMAVPDCEEEIIAGDPAMLIHEHLNFFERQSLRLLLERSGLEARVQKSGYGRSLYALCRQYRGEGREAVAEDVRDLASYPTRCQQFMQRQQGIITALSEKGSIGVYCPSRALAVLSHDLDARLFDDGVTWRGRYIPPFRSRVEGRINLIERPVDNLLVMSRTFGQRIKAEIARSLPNLCILTTSDMMSDETFGVRK